LSGLIFRFEKHKQFFEIFSETLPGERSPSRGRRSSWRERAREGWTAAARSSGSLPETEEDFWILDLILRIYFPGFDGGFLFLDLIADFFSWI